MHEGQGFALAQGRAAASVGHEEAVGDLGCEALEAVQAEALQQPATAHQRAQTAALIEAQQHRREPHRAHVGEEPIEHDAAQETLAFGTALGVHAFDLRACRFEKLPIGHA